MGFSGISCDFMGFIWDFYEISLIFHGDVAGLGFDHEGYGFKGFHRGYLGYFMGYITDHTKVVYTILKNILLLRFNY